MSRQLLNISSHLYQYINEVSVHEPAILSKLRAYTATLPGGHMQITPLQGQLLSLLVQLMDARKMLDIGTFTGYSAITVALAAAPEAIVFTFDKNASCMEIAKQYAQQAQVADKIQFKLGKALDNLQALLAAGEAQSFDFAFIDADKLNYERYYELCLRLIRPGGLIVLDNVLQEGKVADTKVNDVKTQAFRHLNQKIASDARVKMSLLPIDDGLTLALKLSD